MLFMVHIYPWISIFISTPDLVSLLHIGLWARCYVCEVLALHLASKGSQEVLVPFFSSFENVLSPSQMNQ